MGSRLKNRLERWRDSESKHDEGGRRRVRTEKGAQVYRIFSKSQKIFNVNNTLLIKEGLKYFVSKLIDYYSYFIGVTGGTPFRSDIISANN